MGERSQDVSADGAPRPFAAHLTDRWGGPMQDDVMARLQRPDFADIRALVSWRGAVIEPGICPVWLAARYLDLVQTESCGRCSPCRIGTDIMRGVLGRLLEGSGTPNDLDLLRTFAEQIEETAWCGVANTLRDPLVGLLEAGADHFALHMAGTTCPEPDVHTWVTAPCRSTCPSTVDCPSYIFQTWEEHPHLASTIVRRDNPLPGIIGRTCHHPCETNCTLTETGEPIAINFLKRWSADHAEGLVSLPHARVHLPGVAAGHEEMVVTDDLVEAPNEVTEEATAQPSQRPVTALPGSRGQRVAVVGAGPAGLSAAYYLARRGYRPVVFEALPVPGGMLYVGIPEYRLPKAVLRHEVELIEREGAEIIYNRAVGREVGFAELSELGFAATFIAIGAHSGKKLKIPGEDLPGSLDAIEFLRHVALGEPVTLGDRVLVIGGGNSAMDAARTALRLGAAEVQVVYRRAREQMPANPWEVDEAMEEGVHFHFLAAPVSCEGDACVLGLMCQEMELGPPDESGRRSPVAQACDPYFLEADSIIAAVGQQPDFDPFTMDPEISVNTWGYLDVDPFTLMTTKAGVFVGGDAISGGASVIEAIHAGKTVAKYMDAFLRGHAVREDTEDKIRRLAVQLGVQASRYPLRAGAAYGTRQHMPMLPPEVRRSNFSACELGYSDAQAKREASRCLRCHRPILVAT